MLVRLCGSRWYWPICAALLAILALEIYVAARYEQRQAKPYLTPSPHRLGAYPDPYPPMPLSSFTLTITIPLATVIP